ncbi:MAG: hypothetical protein HY431_01595 [Candidatus Levybacteria bacterium]|nr:hypothetical protein [Candidatus Levybacteria bacterium]
MGVIKPSWISKRWFDQCPFNYCDHFGDQELLATVCKICKDDIQRKKLYAKAGKDPYDLKNVFQDMADSFAETHRLLEKMAKEQGIDLNDLSDVPEDDAPGPETYPLYHLTMQYSKSVRQTISMLYAKSATKQSELAEKAMDVLAHSEHYILAKLARAFHSLWEEQKDREDYGLYDSKTSAFLAYLAIVRNKKALHAIARHPSFQSKKKQYKNFAIASEELARLIREKFFPRKKLRYREFGCEEYYACFVNKASRI